MKNIIKKIFSLFNFKGENDVDEDIIAYFKAKGENDVKGISLYDLYKDVEEGDYSYEFICR